MTGSLVGTLARRLALAGLLLTLANIAVISFWYVNWEGLRREKVDEQVSAAVAGLSRGPDGRLRFEPPKALSGLLEAHPDAYALRVADASGAALFERNAAIIPPMAIPAAALEHVDSLSGGAAAETGRVVFATRKVRLGGDVLLVTFAAAADPARLTRGVFLDELVGHVLLPLAPFALLLTIINVWTVRRSLKPLVGAAAAARRMGLSRGVEPLPAEGLPDEVRTLVEATNSALERLASALDHERAFNAEAAHALRTPLAVLSGRLAGMEGPGLESLRADVAAMTRLVNQMLASAQADVLTVPAEGRCDLARVGAELVAQMAPLAIRQGRRLAFEGEGPVIVRGDADALAHAARNLVENALRHASEGSEVTVAAEPAACSASPTAGPASPPRRGSWR